MKIAHITPGAGGMYCGSCFHDNTLAAALKRSGHDTALVPIYTPIRTDEDNVSIDRIFYGAVNVYLQQHSGLFRHTPWLMDRLLDSPSLLGWVSKKGSTIDPKELGALTVSMLRGEHGHQGKELDKLVAWLRDDFRPDIVQVSNSMLLGMVHRIKEELRVPVVCGVQGEDIFLDELPDADRAAVDRLLRERARDADGFLATSSYAAEQMGAKLQVPAEKMHVVPLGLSVEGHGEPHEEAPPSPFRIGYMARICPEKGLHVLLDAFAEVARRREAEAVHLEVAGYNGPRDVAYLEECRKEVTARGLAGSVTFHGEVDRVAKVKLLGRVHVLSVPTTYQEPKGLFVLEALANGTPVVQPAHGAFPELIEKTGGGILYDAESVTGLADALVELMEDPERRAALGQRGQEAVFTQFTDEAMARNTVAVYHRLLEHQNAVA